MTDYTISRPAGQCSVTGRALAEGEAFYSAIVPTDGGFARIDIAEDAWSGPPPEALCHFRTRHRKKSERPRVFVDDAALVEFFLRLENADDDAKKRFRFVLALMLLRKRLLKYETTVRMGNDEIWRMRLAKRQTTHDVMNPRLSEDQIRELTSQLSIILAGQEDLDADDSPAEARVESTDQAAESHPGETLERSMPRAKSAPASGVSVPTRTVRE